MLFRSEVGDYVSKGQKLVQMDAASLKQLRLQLENEETEFKRVDELYKVGGASKSEWDAAKTTLDVPPSLFNEIVPVPERKKTSLPKDIILKAS